MILNNSGKALRDCKVPLARSNSMQSGMSSQVPRRIGVQLKVPVNFERSNVGSTDRWPWQLEG
jgi:hypothetical protein